MCQYVYEVVPLCFHQTPGASDHHAVIEYSERDECYYLEDLASTEGTFVNDCQINMAVVRLIAGNVIRFGFTGIPFEFAIVVLVTVG